MTKLYGQADIVISAPGVMGAARASFFEASLEVRVMKKVVAIEYVSNKSRINYSV